MIQNLGNASADLQGLARLAVEATVGVTDLVESVHHAISHPVASRLGFRPVRGRGLKGAIYMAIRGLTRAVGSGVEVALAPFAAHAARGGGPAPDPARKALLAALNGVVGDHLAASGNPLALAMSVQYEGQPLPLDGPDGDEGIVGAIPQPGTRLLLLIHGLCLDGGRWTRESHGQDTDLARELGFTPLHLDYNSGLHVSTNGRALADLLETLVARWPEPVEQLVILAHSMGGLVARSACHQARVSGQAWLGSLRHLIFLGTPHHGSPLERWGHLLECGLAASPYANAFARLGKLRSAGITDLRHGNLLDPDWQGLEPFAQGRDTRQQVPLPEGVACCTMAATTGTHDHALKGALLGDGLVPMDSALGRHPEARRCLAFPEDRIWLGHGMNHMDLLVRPEVYAQIRRWLSQGQAAGGA